MTKKGVDWVFVRCDYHPLLNPMMGDEEVVRDGEWESRCVLHIKEEAGRFWHNRKKPGRWRFQGYEFHAETAVDALDHLSLWVEQSKREGGT